MRITIDVDRDLLRKAMKLGNVRSRKEAVALALEEFIGARLRERLIAKLRSGTFVLDLTPKELERMRADD